MAVINVYRYEGCSHIISNLDPLSDLVTWLEYYAAIDYLVSLLVTRHGIPANEARQRARIIAPHVRLAREYIDQAISGPRDVAFLPTYYAILNLLKICILFGPHHALLATNRWHGASYEGYGTDSQNLLTDKITLKRGGALPLFYRTLTGQIITKDIPLRLSEIYPFILDISSEYGMAAGREAQIVDLQFEVVEINKRQHLRVAVFPLTGNPIPNLRQLKVLVGFKKDAAKPELFISKPIAGILPPQIRPHLRPYLLYHHVNGSPATRVSGSHLVFPEEFPIALAFFHMSSVVRYKPEFLARLKDSKYWPVLSTLRRHALFKFLIAFWSFTHKKTLALNE